MLYINAIRHSIFYFVWQWPMNETRGKIVTYSFCVFMIYSEFHETSVPNTSKTPLDHWWYSIVDIWSRWLKNLNILIRYVCSAARSRTFLQNTTILQSKMHKSIPNSCRSIIDVVDNKNGIRICINLIKSCTNYHQICSCINVLNWLYPVFFFNETWKAVWCV